MYERHHVEITREDVPFANLPEGLQGLRIGFMSDLHRSPSVPHELIATAVQALLSEHPDVIVLGGDYVTWGDQRYVGPVAEALAPLSAPHGVFAVLGNHDLDRDLPPALAARGFAVLCDQRTQITIKGEKLDFVGVKYWTRRLSEIEHILRGASPAAILLAHTPMRYHQASELHVPLVLSGHTHGGQVVLPGLGALAVRKYPVASGVGFHNQTTIFVTRGVGTVYVPVRVNCPPEVAVLTLVQGVRPGSDRGQTGVRPHLSRFRCDLRAGGVSTGV